MGSLSLSPAPPPFLRLSGHPVRWQLLTELAQSDRQVRELTVLVSQRQSLTSYHLAQLRANGLVRMRRSSADRRDSYYSLDLAACRDRLAEAGAALHPGIRLAATPLIPAADVPPQVAGARPVRVLFLCTGNSSRSQMAEALLQRLSGGRVEAVSAGSQPKTLHPDAVRVMNERGVDISGRRSKHLRVFTGQRFDQVITLCDRVREVCPQFPGTPAVSHWSIADPAANPGGYPAFVRLADELTIRIEFLLSALEQARTRPKEARHG